MPHRWKAAAPLTALLLCAAGCANHEKAVRGRAQVLIGHLCKNDLDACVKMADPAQVRRESEGLVKLRFGVLAGLIKLGKLTEADVRIDSVAVGKDANTADVVISLRSQGEWKAQPASRWVKVDGVWYIALA